MALGAVAYDVIGIRKNITLENLRRAFGGSLGEGEIEHIARESYGNIGLTFIEMMILPRLKKHIPDIVDISEITVLERCLERGRGLVLVSGHYGSWELNGAALGLAGLPMTVVGKRQSNPYVDKFVTQYRSDMGMKMVTHGAPIKQLLRALKNGEIVGLISDQDSGKRGIFVDFFGEKASTPAGAAQLSIKYSAPVVLTTTTRTSPGHYVMSATEIEVSGDDTVETLTRRYTEALENVIRRHPEQYFWMHRRWKTRPPHHKKEKPELSQAYIDQSTVAVSGTSIGAKTFNDVNSEE
jgi:KDO2-lipid IV(A) lauroyltransferase